MAAHVKFAAPQAIEAQAFVGDGTFKLIATIDCTYGSHRRGSLAATRRYVTITGTVSGEDLTGFKLSRAAIPGGTHKDWLSDADFNTPTTKCPDATEDLYTTAAGGTFQLSVDLSGVAELNVYAKAASGTPSLALEIG